MAASMWGRTVVNTVKLVYPVLRRRNCHKLLVGVPKYVGCPLPLNNYVGGRTIYLTSVHYCTVSDETVKKMMDTLTDKFTEARELMQDARESQGSVYFSDDMSEAQEAVQDTLDEYKSLLSKLNETQKQNVVRTIGLRMEELKAQQTALEESLKD
ncbi:uncharacterized protein LOC110453892 [Mizuhopecten yessoensis]|uniref:Uncharacterized protein n=1 Tax=Mizuhopecten yessoensis TaxID=6573 RepID=A0A210QGE1_MIZYE|nr:uncharacterized protein LOC110453892 [Mizuhopecten yessoensis]OWF47820.1 hypothetical protein KP79_PYT06106 [Mizuhopecten yessoensis]